MAPKNSTKTKSITVEIEQVNTETGETTFISDHVESDTVPVESGTPALTAPFASPKKLQSATMFPSQVVSLSDLAIGGSARGRQPIDWLGKIKAAPALEDGQAYILAEMQNDNTANSTATKVRKVVNENKLPFTVHVTRDAKIALVNRAETPVAVEG